MVGKPNSRTSVKKLSNLSCIGSICFGEDGTIVVEPDKDSCPEPFQRKLIEQVFQGKKVEFKLPKEEKG